MSWEEDYLMQKVKELEGRIEKLEKSNEAEDEPEEDFEAEEV